MKSGILKENEGYDIIVNGERRSFRDDKSIAIQAPQNLASEKGAPKVEVRDRAGGVTFVVDKDGRVR